MNSKGSIIRLGLGAALLLAALAPGSARAESGASDWFVTDQGKVRLVAAEPATGDARTLPLGLDFRLAPHWKIYWRSPGDAGFPPRLDWAGSTNLARADLRWPAPQRFSVQGLETVGYTDRVVLPIAAELSQPGAAAHLHLALSYLTCNDICIPYDTVLTLDLPGGVAAGPGGFAGLIARYAAKVPGDGAGSGLKLAAATVLPGRHPMLELLVASAQPLLAPDAFVEGPAGTAFGAPHIVRGEAPGETMLRLPINGDKGASDRLVGQKLTVTLVDDARALEAVVAPASGPPEADLGLLLRILPLALLGGFILNFMPCVLPVLSIKLLGVIRAGERSRHALRLGFLATASGVLLSFLALAVALAALKAVGIAVGWGLQFQQPLFLTAMVALLTLFACNLWGVFEVPLPGWLGDIGAAGEGHGLIGNVAAGAFATLLATPCSAPFLGTALGFALAAGPVEIIAVFLALGLGLAAPYLLVALFPGLARLLPRPGRWMVTVRRILGLALAATALWLLTVLVTQIGMLAALVIAGLMAGAALALVLLTMPAARRVVPALLFAAAFLVPVALSAPPRAASEEAFWRPFDRDAIAGLVGAGQVVFVDVTADWCLTCKLNKEFVIDQPDVTARLERPGVVAMRADWTRPDDAIAAYLRSFGRYGIPFNAVYGPGAPQGKALSELLTPDQVLSTLAAAAGPGQVVGAAAGAPPPAQ